MVVLTGCKTFAIATTVKADASIFIDLRSDRVAKGNAFGHFINLTACGRWFLNPYEGVSYTIDGYSPGLFINIVAAYRE